MQQRVFLAMTNHTFMNPPSHRSRKARRALRGVTLVELLVALTISLVLALAAIGVYLSTRTSQRSLDEVSAAAEAGTFALRTLGRDLANAGFYPAARSETGKNGVNTLSVYRNLTGRTADDTGLFGCDGADFDPVTGTCGTSIAGASDALVIGYFTNDAYGTSVGQRADCEGNDVAGAAVNSTRLGSLGLGRPPLLPLFASNRYQLTAAQTTTVDGAAASTRSLACDGNGTGDGAFTALTAGIDDLQLTYGVFNSDTRIADRYYTASEVNGLGMLTIDGKDLPAWGRVTAVRVCIVARTYQSATAVAANTSPPTYTDCNGDQVTNAAGDASLRRTYVQVFGGRNWQSASY
jgi:type IV pilus assembly protein PilW